jgi:hypothetical protein
MFYMSLKYILFTLLHVSTTQGRLQVTIFFFNESIALYTMSLVLLSMSLFINLVLHGAPLPRTKNTEPTQDTHGQEVVHPMMHRAAAIQKIQWAPRALFPGVKRPRREADHSPPASAEVKKTWISTSTPPYAFMAWCLIS